MSTDDAMKIDSKVLFDINSINIPKPMEKKTSQGDQQ